MMINAAPNPVLMIEPGYSSGKIGWCAAKGGRLIVRLRSQSRWDDKQEDEGLKKEGADMANDASSGLGGENVDKNNDLWLKKGMNSKVFLKGRQNAEYCKSVTF